MLWLQACSRCVHCTFVSTSAHDNDIDVIHSVQHLSGPCAVEQIDVGEAEPRTIVSGLVKFVPLEEMQVGMHACRVWAHA